MLPSSTGTPMTSSTSGQRRANSASDSRTNSVILLSGHARRSPASSCEQSTKSPSRSSLKMAILAGVRDWPAGLRKPISQKRGSVKRRSRLGLSTKRSRLRTIDLAKAFNANCIYKNLEISFPCYLQAEEFVWKISCRVLTLGGDRCSMIDIECNALTEAGQICAPTCQVGGNLQLTGDVRR